MKKVLVTGGAGAIGRTLVKKILEKGYQVYILDDLSSGHKFNIHSEAHFIKGNVEDREVLNNLFESHEFNYIFHLAALFANQNSVDHPDKDLMVNGMGSMLLMEKATEHYKQGHLEQFLYASSSCVYGMFEGAVPETASFNPETPYAITKLLGEYYLRYFHEVGGLPFTCFRFFNSYGPGEIPGAYRNVIPNFIKLALIGEPLIITGTGNETRDFTFIEDGMNGVMSTLGSEIALGKTYNIATGKETTIKELAEKIIHISGSSSKIIFKPKRNWDGVMRRCGDITSMKKDLDFKPGTSLDEGLKKTVAWIRAVQEEQNLF